MEMALLRVASAFSPRPYGRYPAHGPDNGERFRDEFLAPILRERVPTIVDLDGARGLGPSFLEEAFGGLVRLGFTPEDIRQFLLVKSDSDPSYIAEIQSYIDDAAKSARH
jgi:hypothetical protein